MSKRTSVVATAIVSLFLVAAEGGQPSGPSSLFDLSKVWTIHLKFSAEQWAAMEPKGGPASGGPEGAGFPGGPGGFGGPGGRGGPGGMGPVMMIAPSFMKGDTNHDGKLSREEFQKLGEGWFEAWDRQKQGKLTTSQLRAGLDATLQFAGGRPGMPPGGGRGPGMGMQGQDGRNGMSAMMGIDFKYVHADLDFNGTILKDIAVRYKGNSTYMQSRGSLKRSLKLDLNKYVKGQKLAGISKFNLHSNVTDAGWMNEPLSYRLFRDGEVPSPRTSYARVYLTVAGKYDKQYVGLYSVVEDIDKNFANELFSTRDGAILKPSTRSLFADLGDDWSKYSQIYDPKTDLTVRQKQRVIDFAKLVTHANDADFAVQLPSFVDVDEFARYLAINVWLANMDSILAMGQNFYLYLNPSTGKFVIIPWDLDLSFGGMGGGPELSIEQPWRGQNRFLERLFKVESFKRAYLTHMREFSESIFKADRLSRQVDETAAVIRSAVAEESDSKLARFDKTVAGERAARGFGGPGGGGPGGPGGEPIKAFVAERTKSVALQLAGKSKGQQGRGGPGEGGGPPEMGGPPGMGGPEGRGPGSFLAPAFLRAMDANADGVVTREEFQRGFAKWFDAWAGAQGPLTEEQLRAGIGKDLAPGRDMMPGFGPPPQ